MILLFVSELVKFENLQLSGASPSVLSLGAFRCCAHTQVRASARQIDPASMLRSGVAHESRAQATGLICPAVPLPFALHVLLAFLLWPTAERWMKAVPGIERCPSSLSARQF